MLEQPIPKPPAPPATLQMSVCTDGRLKPLYTPRRMPSATLLIADGITTMKLNAPARQPIHEGTAPRLTIWRWYSAGAGASIRFALFLLDGERCP
jgi:hypothetical protein